MLSKCSTYVNRRRRYYRLMWRAAGRPPDRWAYEFFEFVASLLGYDDLDDVEAEGALADNDV